MDFKYVILHGEHHPEAWRAERLSSVTSQEEILHHSFPIKQPKSQGVVMLVLMLRDFCLSVTLTWQGTLWRRHDRARDMMCADKPSSNFKTQLDLIPLAHKSTSLLWQHRHCLLPHSLNCFKHTGNTPAITKNFYLNWLQQDSRIGGLHVCLVMWIWGHGRPPGNPKPSSILS